MPLVIIHLRDQFEPSLNTFPNHMQMDFIRRETFFNLKLVPFR